MIHIEFTEPQTPEWQQWRQACQEEQERHNEAIEAGLESKVNSRLYKGQKAAVYEDPNGPFRGKCAYCESGITSPRTQPGDIEHFRPKSAVTEEDGSPVMIMDEGVARKHPGYYWLAYDWRNLLLSCNTCNRRQRDLVSGKLVGKSTLFPVRRFRACRPGEETSEEPLLLNPVADDPSEHLSIDDTGVLSWPDGDERGETTVEILGLNWRGLPNERKERYQTVRLKYGVLAQALAISPDGNELTSNLFAELKGAKEGHGEYAIAARKAIRDVRESSQLLDRFDD